MNRTIPLLLIAVIISCSKVEQPGYDFPIAPDCHCTLENIYLTQYLDDAEQKYTDTNWKTVSVIKDNSSIWSGQTTSNRKDCPAPAEISWTTSAEGQKYVRIYSDSTMAETVRTATTEGNTIKINNLIPERRYFYTVSTSDGNILIGGKLITYGRRRMIRISDQIAETHANNCRDLGGLKTVDGRTVRYGLIYRGGRMDETTVEEKNCIVNELGIKMDCDLRKDGICVFSDKKWGVRYSLSTYGSFGGQNKEYNLDYGPNIKHTFTDIIEAATTASPCYIHCSAGADRTGYICMLMEAVLGVSQKDCSIDYEMTSFSVVGGRDRTCTIKDYYFEKGMTYIENYPKGNTFNEKAENILLDAGITAAQISEFRTAMLY